MKMAAESVRTRRFRVFAPGAPRARPRKTSVPARVHLLFTHKFNGSLLAECPDQFGFTARAECRLGGRSHVAGRGLSNQVTSLLG